MATQATKQESLNKHEEPTAKPAVCTKKQKLGVENTSGEQE